MDNQSQEVLYRSLRKQHHFLSAVDAWRQAGEIVETNRWAASVEFAWQSHRDKRYVLWCESGYELTAHFVEDENGWALKNDTIGKFSDQWQPGAIAHEVSNHRTFDWFIPADADPSMAHWLYKRACDYRFVWIYTELVVTAHRGGIELASASLSGVESDTADSHLTRMVFDLKDEVIDTADEVLRELCALIPAGRKTNALGSLTA